MPFLVSPPNHFRQTPLAHALVKRDSLLQGIQLLLDKAAIVEIPVDQWIQDYYSILFIVQKVSGGFRPVLDLKEVNTFIPHISFKMMSLQVIVPFLH